MKFSIVYYSDVSKKFDFRIDAKYYHPSKINNLQVLKKKSKRNIEDFVDHMKQTTYPKNKDILTYDTSSACFHILDANLAQTKERTSLKKITQAGDVIISRLRPYLKQVAYIPDSIQQGYLTTEFMILRSKDKENISFLTAFLLTKGIQNILSLCQGGTQHPRFSEQDLLSIPIPEEVFCIKELLNNLMVESSNFLSQSFLIYIKAEQLLFAELRLENWQLEHELYFVRNFSETQRAKRIDARYFQPEYIKIINAIKNYSGGYNILENLLQVKDKKFYPIKSKKYKYIELSNISLNGEIMDCTESLGENLPTRARRKISQGDVIVSSIEGSLDSIAFISKDWHGALCSNGFFVINSEIINSETLFIFMKSKIGQMQLKQNCRGVILASIRKQDFQNMIIPNIKMETQEAIKEKIGAMYQAKKISKRLIEIATEGVEKAIEQNESVAEQWIRSETEKLGISL